MDRFCVIGVDLGGTNVRARAYFQDGSPAGERSSNPSKAQDGTDAILAQTALTIQQAVDAAEAPCRAVGLAIPGHIDNAEGLVRWAPNFGESIDGIFRSWRNVPIRQPLQARVNLPIYMDNDANLAALGEYMFGTGRNSAHCLVLLTLGTGVGGGVVMSPHSVVGDCRGPLMLVGGNKGGAELGHIVLTHGGLDCHAGSYGSLEAYCQRDSVVKRVLHRLRRGRKSSITDLVHGDLSRITPLTISQAADQGDDLAIEVWTEVGTWLGVGIGSCVNIFAPDVVAIGGQIAKAGEHLLGPARKTALNIAIPSLFEDVKIVQAEQIDDAGMMGGAALALESLNWGGEAR